jgi:predicted secreted protein
MSKSTYAASFFLIWWVVLFAVLPWGVQSQHESGDTTPGTDPGAPVMPKLGRKLLWTTLVAALVFSAFYVVTANRLLTFADFLALFGLHDPN